MTTPESSLKRYFRQEAVKLGCEVHALRGDKYLPDYYVFMPGGRLLLLEIKPDGARPTPRWDEQLKALQRFKDLGYSTYFAVGRGDVDKVLCEIERVCRLRGYQRPGL